MALAQAASPRSSAAQRSNAPAPAPPAPAPGSAPSAPASKPPAKPSSRNTAEQDDKPTPERVKRARDLWYRGVEAFRNGKYEEARVAFAECYQLMPKSDVLRNLSISELHSGHYVDAARHLTQLLASPGELPEKVREEANNRLAQAQAQIGQLAITVDVPGAEIRIDDQVIGTSPLEGNWYIEPGQHQISVSKQGYPVEERQVFALAGVSIPVSVSLEALRTEQANEARAARLMGTHEGQAAGERDGGLSTASTVTIAALSGVAVLGLSGGIVFTVAANGHQSKVEGYAVRLASTGACWQPQELALECEALKSQRAKAVADRKRAIGSFIGFGVASAAALGYALWLTLDDDEGAVEDAPQAGNIAPAVSTSPGGGTVGVRGWF